MPVSNDSFNANIAIDETPFDKLKRLIVSARAEWPTLDEMNCYHPDDALQNLHEACFELGIALPKMERLIPVGRNVLQEMLAWVDIPGAEAEVHGRYRARVDEISKAFNEWTSLDQVSIAKTNYVPKKRRGRLPKEESQLLQTNALAQLREHPTLADDPAKLAVLVGTTEDTARRWIDKFREANLRGK